MSTIYGPQFSFNPGSTEVEFASSGHRVWRAYWDGSGNVNVDASVDQGYSFPTSVTVDNTISTPGLNDVALNESLAYDPVTSRLHLLYEAHTDDVSNPCVLYHKSSINNGATWSSRHLLDAGTTHLTAGSPNDRFYRVGIIAYADYVTAWYTSEINTTFVTDGLWETHSSNGGETWSAFAKIYTSPVCPFEPNVVLGSDASVHVSWYDPLVVANQGGDVYYVRGTWNGAGWTWPALVTQLTSGETWGRTRPFTSNGVVHIVGNTNWGGAVADVGLLRSTDNGTTWAATTTIATHAAGGPLSHPSGAIDSDHAAVIWSDLSTTPVSYGASISTDAGATWSAVATPLTNTSSSGDAPRIIVTDDLFIAIGYDQSLGVIIWSVYPAFAPDPQQASSVIIDAFNRANENPLSNGGKWTLNTDAGNNLKLVSNHITRQLASGSFDRSGNYRNDFTVTGSYELYVDCVTAGGEINLFLWNPSTKNGYWLVMSDSDFGVSNGIARFDSGTATNIASSTVFGLTAGETYLIRLDAKDVSLAKKNTGGNWLEVLRGPDTTYRTTLNVAIDITGSAGTPVADNFGGGVLNAPSNTVAPRVSGVIEHGSTLTAVNGTWATAAGATPTRFTYQWQHSIDGGMTWHNIKLATLKFFTISSASGASSVYRCNVTGINSLGSATVVSNAICNARLIFGTAS